MIKVRRTAFRKKSGSFFVDLFAMQSKIQYNITSLVLEVYYILYVQNLSN